MAEGIQPVQTTIELFDAFTAPMMSIINAANLGANAISAMQDVVSASIDPSSMQVMTQNIEEARTAAERFQEAIRGMEIPESSLPEVTRPVQVPFEWQSTNNIEVFNTSGAERWRQEIASAQEMMNQLDRSQERITQNAVYTNILPPDAANDMIALNDRIGAIQQRITQISRNRLNATSPQAIEQTEQLRMQINRCLQLQNQMNAAVGSLDLEAANRAYLELERTVGNTERFIRDNVSEQGNFNNAIRAGQNEADKLTSFIKKAAGAFLSIKGAEKIVEMSDSLVTAKSRLNMMGDGDELYTMIYGAAQRARGSLDGMTDVVARFGNNAKDAFSSNAEVVVFSELVQKQMTIAGASTAEASNAMLQLSQALGSGVLRGDELNSIFEQAPNLIQGIADYLGAPIGEIRKMASEGELTADVVKNSVFKFADEINERFENMPMTWGQMWQSMQNQATVALEPILERVNEIFSDDRFQAGLAAAMDGFVTLCTVALDVLNIIADAAAWTAQNWSVIGPIVMTAAVAFGIYKTATLGASIAQNIMNGALFACPLFWIIAAVVAFIAVIGIATKAINDVYGLTLSFGGMLGGSIMVILAALGNLIIDLVNLFLLLGNVGVGCWEALKAVVENIFTFFYNSVASIRSMFWDILANFMSFIEMVCEALNKLPFINFDYSGVTSAANDFAKKSAEANNEKLEYTDVGAAFDRGMNSIKYLDRIDYGEAFEAGYAIGDKIGQSFNYENDVNAALNSTYDYGSMISDIADNTGDIKDGLDITGEDLKYLRDIAEQEAINRFTTAEIHIEAPITNNVSSDTDLDGLIDGLTEALNEAVSEVAEGVHV